MQPDISAVAQLLGQLLNEVNRLRPGWKIKAICSTDVRPKDRLNLGRSPQVSHSLCPTHLIGQGAALKTALKFFVYHCWVFVSLLFQPERRTVISFTTPPLIGFTAALACRIRRHTFVHYVEDLYPELLLDARIVRTPALAKKSAALNRMTIATAKKIVVIGPYMARKLWLNYGCPSQKMVAIENWSSQEFSDSVPPPPRISFTYSGNFGFAHDFALFTKFISRFDGEHPELVLSGAGKRTRSVIAAAQSVSDLKLKTTNYLSDQEHKRLLLDSAFLVVSQDYRTIGDVFPSKFYSYIAAGRPVILFGSRMSEIGGYVLEHDIGTIIEVEADLGTATEWVRKIVLDPARYAATCTRTRALSKRLGGARRAANQFVETIEGLYAP